MWLPSNKELPAYEAGVTELRQQANCFGEFTWVSHHSNLGPTPQITAPRSGFQGSRVRRHDRRPSAMRIARTYSGSA